MTSAKTSQSKRSHSLKPWPPKRANLLSCIWLISFEPEQLGGATSWQMKQNVLFPGMKRIQVNRKVWKLSSEICTYIHPCLAGLGGMWLVMLYWQKMKKTIWSVHPFTFSRTAFIFLKTWLDWCIYRKSITGRGKSPLADNICIERLRHLALNWTENSLETMLKHLQWLLYILECCLLKFRLRKSVVSISMLGNIELRNTECLPKLLVNIWIISIPSAISAATYVTHFTVKQTSDMQQYIMWTKYEYTLWLCSERPSFMERVS